MSRFNIGSGLFAMLLTLVSAHSNATSFDCTKAASFAEKSICTDSALSRLDEQMNSEYVRALDAAPNKAQVRQDQRDWLRLRDNCKTASCLTASMTDRLVFYYAPRLIIHLKRQPPLPLPGLINLKRM
ncbi:lysozyme inhibitor LprI family protein [Pseudomonas hormoni]